MWNNQVKPIDVAIASGMSIITVSFEGPIITSILAVNANLTKQNKKMTRVLMRIKHLDTHKSKQHQRQTYTHQMKSSIKWRLPNICPTVFVNSPVRYAEQDSNESDCSSDVNWSSRSCGDIYVNKRNNCIIQVSWKVESISYVSGPVVSRAK